MHSAQSYVLTYSRRTRQNLWYRGLLFIRPQYFTAADHWRKRLCRIVQKADKQMRWRQANYYGPRFRIIGQGVNGGFGCPVSRFSHGDRNTVKEYNITEIVLKKYFKKVQKCKHFIKSFKATKRVTNRQISKLHSNLASSFPNRKIKSQSKMLMRLNDLKSKGRNHGSRQSRESYSLAFFRPTHNFPGPWPCKKKYLLRKILWENLSVFWGWYLRENIRARKHENKTQFNTVKLNQPKPNITVPMRRDTARKKERCK